MSEKTPGEVGEPRGDSSRRRFCQVAIGGMAVVTVGTVGYPVLTFLQLPRSLRPQETMEVALADLREGSAAWGEHMGRQIVVLKLDGEVRAFNGACPHLGCIVQWDEPSRTFKCPCHGAAFSGAGSPISGPVNSPLTPIQFEIEDDILKIA